MFNPFSQIEFYREDAQLKEVAWRSIDEQVSLAKSTQKMLACALFDIDHFGPIVRSCGSETGRLILSECLTRIQEESGQVMSYGRDEFVIVQSVKGVEDAMFSVERLRQDLAEIVSKMACHEMASQGQEMGCSAGVAIYPIHANEGVALLGKAEEGLYLAKRYGRNLTKIPSQESMMLKSNYYSNVQLARLEVLAHKTGRTEASLLREALDRFLRSYDT